MNLRSRGASSQCLGRICLTRGVASSAVRAPSLLRIARLNLSLTESTTTDSSCFEMPCLSHCRQSGVQSRRTRIGNLCWIINEIRLPTGENSSQISGVRPFSRLRSKFQCDLFFNQTANQLLNWVWDDGGGGCTRLVWGVGGEAVWTAEVYCGFLSSFLAHVMNSWAVHHCTPTIPALYGT